MHNNLNLEIKDYKLNFGFNTINEKINGLILIFRDELGLEKTLRIATGTAEEAFILNTFKRNNLIDYTWLGLSLKLAIIDFKVIALINPITNDICLLKRGLSLNSKEIVNYKKLEHLKNKYGYNELAIIEMINQKLTEKEKSLRKKLV